MFASPANGWRGACYPAATLAVLDDSTFARGHHTPQEGGPKGLELDPRTNVLLVTCEETPLLCVDAGSVVDDPWRVGPSAARLVRYELHAISAVDGATPIARIARIIAAASAHAEFLEAELAAIKATRAWRLLEQAAQRVRHGPPPRGPPVALSAPRDGRGGQTPRAAARRPARPPAPPRPQPPRAPRTPRRPQRRAPGASPAAACVAAISSISAT